MATGASGLMFGSSAHDHRTSSLMSSEEASAAAPAKVAPKWEAAVGYRWFRSHRHFVGATEQTHREEEGSEVVNNNHLIDVSLTRSIGARWRVQVGIPIVSMSRWGPDRAGGLVVGRRVTRSGGVGDARILASRWLLSPNNTGNVALGLGVKLPTGKFSAYDEVAGTPRPVDQSIQPGDGGTGAIVTLEAFRTGFLSESWYFAGSYLANPRGMNGVQTFRSRASEAIMSVADQYIARAGTMFPIWRSQGLAGMLGARLEGVPSEDILGPSFGFRRPGLTASIEPGLSLVRGPFATTLAVPVAFHRERQQSYTDKRDGRHGDAAFADWSVAISQSVRY